MKCWKKITIIALILCQFFPISLILAVSDDFYVNLEVETEVSSVCDDDGVCDTGETSSTCPNDCGCNNNGSCQSQRGETTSNCPNDCPQTPGGGELPDQEAPVIYDIQVYNITFSSADISWKTVEQARCQLFFGATMDYELFVVSENILNRVHQTSFSGLSAGLAYNFKISCRDNAGNESTTGNNIFSTLAIILPDITPPANVSNFQASSSDQKIPLTWQNPPDQDLAGIIIVRGEDFYPSNPQEGIVVYDGPAEGVIDINLINGKEYYYTAFTYDQSGNYSSGAIVSGIPVAPGVILPPVKPPIEPPTGPTLPEIEVISFNDFNFFQNGKPLSVVDGNRVVVESLSPLTALINYEKVPEVLKTILFSLEKENKYFSFLLRINKDKTHYIAKLAPPSPGKYPLTIYVLDYKNQALKKISGFLEVRGEAMMPKVDFAWWQGIVRFLETEPGILLLLLLFIVILLILLYLVKRKYEKDQEKEDKYC